MLYLDQIRARFRTWIPKMDLFCRKKNFAESFVSLLTLEIRDSKVGSVMKFRNHGSTLNYQSDGPFLDSRFVIAPDPPCSRLHRTVLEKNADKRVYTILEQSLISSLTSRSPSISSSIRVRWSRPATDVTSNVASTFLGFLKHLFIFVH